MRSLLLAIVTALTVNLAAAVEVAGVRLDEKVRVGNSELLFNGGGLRKKLLIKVYVMGLYLPEKRSDAEAVLTSKGGKRIAITLLRDLSAKQFVDALDEGLANNHSEAEMAALKERLQQFTESLLTLGEAKAGNVILIDWLPDGGTRLTINGQMKGKDISGEDFYRALLKIWLGNKPVQEDLKQALLGKAT